MKIPIIGMGGIQNAADAIEFMMAGATAVAVGTANFYEPQTALQVIAGIREFMQRHGIQDVREIVGSVRTEQVIRWNKRPSADGGGANPDNSRLQPAANPVT